MSKTMIDPKVMDCERQYIKCLSKEQVDDKVIRFTDEQLKAMYDQNFTLINESNSSEELEKMIAQEVSLRKADNYSFCNIQTFSPLNDEQLAKYGNQAAVSTKGFYLFDLSKFDQILTRSDCHVVKVTNTLQLNDKLIVELDDESDQSTVEFVKNKEKRKEDVYLGEGKIEGYICYDEQDQVVGSCDLFIHGKTAKIEDFTVISEKQRRGYGTVLIKELLKFSREQGVTNIYLVTDESETAKEMYQKLGFKKIGEQMSLLFQL